MALVLSARTLSPAAFDPGSIQVLEIGSWSASARAPTQFPNRAHDGLQFRKWEAAWNGKGCKKVGVLTLNSVVGDSICLRVPGGHATPGKNLC